MAENKTNTGCSFKRVAIGDSFQSRQGKVSGPFKRFRKVSGSKGERHGPDSRKNHVRTKHTLLAVMKHQPWQYALAAFFLCCVALPAALAVSVFLLLIAAVALVLWPIVATAVYLASRDTLRAERRAKYGGPVAAHPVETCSCEVCACRREYLYGSREPQTQG